MYLYSLCNIWMVDFDNKITEDDKAVNNLPWSQILLNNDGGLYAVIFDNSCMQGRSLLEVVFVNNLVC